MSTEESGGKNLFPFNSYDVFAYLIPGAVFLLVVYVYEYWCIDHLGYTHNPVHSIFQMFWPSASGEKLEFFNIPAFQAIVIFVSVLLFLYLMGHIIAAISSLYVDRVLVKKAHYYPFELFLGRKKNETTKSKAIKSNFILFNISTLAVYLSAAFFEFMTIMKFHVDYTVFHCMIGLLVMISLSSFIFSFSYSKSIFGLNLFSGLYSGISKRLRSVIGTESDISNQTISQFKSFMKKHLGLKKTTTSTDVYWLSFIFIVKKSPSANKALMNWLHLYSFARNVSVCFFLAYLYSVTSLILNLHNSDINDFSGLGTFKILVGLSIPILFWLLSILFLLRFFYLYVSYYSKFLIRSCANYYVENKRVSEK